jgi:hypothetical protein
VFTKVSDRVTLFLGYRTIPGLKSETWGTQIGTRTGSQRPSLDTGPDVTMYNGETGGLRAA